MPPDSALAGRRLANRYEVLALLGVGGMGAVYRARDLELDELVALKVIRSDLAGDPVIVDRFRREVKLARRVTHPNVARTFELGDADGMMFCTMELIEGESLTRRLARLRQLSITEAVTIACAICDALTAAHAVDVIHRDIKPDNVLIARGGRVVLADFGIAAVRIEGTSDISGTAAYMAPEQALGEPATPATDVYAVGVVLYEMLTGSRAFAGSVAQILEAKQAVERLTILPASGLDAKLADVVAAATARDVSVRIPSAAALRARIGGWADVSTVEAPADRAADPQDVQTLVVLSPRSERDGSRMYLADAVHEQLLLRLARQRRVRVLPRVVASMDPDTTMVSLVASDVLTVSLSTPERGETLRIRLPLTIEQVAESAEAAANAIAAALVVAVPPERPLAHEALDLLLQARYIRQRDTMHLRDAVEMLERANALLPGDPRITANLAVLHVRRAFFSPHPGDALIARSRDLVREALAAGPRLSEARLAAGHLELNLGEASVAAGHYRVAIACAPHCAEAHESLGRMLLEAGFLDAGFARLGEAFAIAPTLASIRWDIARAFALEQRWTEHDEVMADLASRTPGGLRATPLLLRFAVWRQDFATVAALREDPGTAFDPVLIAEALAVYTGGPWAASRDLLVSRIPEARSGTRRRRAFIAQLVAEVAGFARDAETCLAMIGHAVDEGLFDAHWLDRCPLLEVVRPTPELAAYRARVRQRADAVLDALYGDHVADTAAASSP